MSLEKKLGKRKFGDACDNNNFDDERYGNHIDIDYFIKGGIDGVFVSRHLTENNKKEKIKTKDLQIITIFPDEPHYTVRKEK